MYIVNNTSNKRKYRALLDVGSQAHFVTEDLYDILVVTFTPVKTTVGSLDKNNQSHPRSKAQLPVPSVRKYHGGESIKYTKYSTSGGEKVPVPPMCHSD
jgi:hypothetical protein